jgi:hypothetical protein
MKMQDLNHGFSEDWDQWFALESGGTETSRYDSNHPAPKLR